MNKVSAAARGCAILVAIASGFVSAPLIAPLLLILGGIAAIGNDAERNSKNILMAIVLILGAQTLDTIPYVGSFLATIFGSLGVAFVGASIVAITITLGYRLERDWLK
jgi:hypothetical protein